MPNITGGFWDLTVTADSATTMGQADGAFYTGYTSPTIGIITDEKIVNKKDGIGLDASRSSAVYGRSTTVQPPALRLISQCRF